MLPSHWIGLLLFAHSVVLTPHRLRISCSSTTLAMVKAVVRPHRPPCSTRHRCTLRLIALPHTFFLPSSNRNIKKKIRRRWWHWPRRCVCRLRLFIHACTSSATPSAVPLACNWYVCVIFCPSLSLENLSRLAMCIVARLQATHLWASGGTVTSCKTDADTSVVSDKSASIPAPSHHRLVIVSTFTSIEVRFFLCHFVLDCCQSPCLTIW
jgi:hypothetical protein